MARLRVNLGHPSSQELNRLLCILQPKDFLAAPSWTYLVTRDELRLCVLAHLSTPRSY